MISASSAMLRSALTASRTAFGIPRVTPGPVSAVRLFHGSQPALKKRKHATPDESFDDLDNDPSESDDLDDLFDVSHLPTQLSSSSSASRADLIAHLRSTLALSPPERKKVARNEMKGDMLGRIVELSAASEATKLRDVEELRGVLRGWRMLGLRVGEEVGEAVVDKCIAAGRPDLAHQYSSDRIQYGLPELDPRTASRLSNALATFVSADDGPGGATLGTVEPKA